MLGKSYILIQKMTMRVIARYLEKLVEDAQPSSVLDAADAQSLLSGMNWLMTLGI